MTQGHDATASHVPLDLQPVRTTAGLPPFPSGEPVTLPAREVGGQSQVADDRPDPSRVQVLGEIARGGIGRVLRGHDPVLRRDLAVKVLLEPPPDRPADVQASIEQRFVEEAQIGGQLQHPGIVPVYELGRCTNGRPYFTMKLVKGRTLAELLKERTDPATELPRFLKVFEQVCQTLAYAHARRVVHRDLKPLNVMVGAFGEVQVMDWGLAKILSAEPRDVLEEPTREPSPAPTEVRTIRTEDPALATQAGAAWGTYPYMPPEQARGQSAQVDERSDVFALGSILCEILTGQPAYASKSKEDAYYKAAAGDLSEAFGRLDASGADADLRALTRSCLAIDPSARPADAGAVAAAIGAHLASVQDRLRKAEIDGAAAQARAMEAKRTTRRTVALAASIMLLAALGLGSWSWIQKERAIQLNVRRFALERHLDEARRHLARAEADASANNEEVWDRAVDAILQAAEQAALHFGDDHSLYTEVRELSETVIQGRKQAIIRMHLEKIDRGMLAKLASIRVRMVDGYIYRSTIGADEYAQEFINWATMDPDQAAERIRQRPQHVQQAVTTALDHWALFAKKTDRSWPYQVAQRLDPDHWRNRVREAITHEDAGKLRDLVKEVQEKDVVATLSPTTLEIVGHAFFLYKDPQSAERWLRAAVLRHPDDVWINYVLGIVIRWQGQPRFTEAVSMERHDDGRPKRTLSRDRLRDSIRYLQAARALHPSLGNELAHRLIEDEQEDEGIALLVELTRRHPDDKFRWKCLGSHWQAKGEHDRAIEAYQRALDLDPKYAEAMSLMASAWQRKGDVPRATALFEQAVALYPQLFSAHNALGVIAYKQGHHAEALAAFDRAVAALPTHADAHKYRGDALVQLKRSDDAIAAYQRAVELKPDYHLAHFQLGVTQGIQGRHAEAVAAFDERLRHAPENVTAHRLRGRYLGRLGRPEEGIPAIERAVQLDPKDAWAHNDLGYLLREVGRLDEAEACFKKALELQKDHAAAASNLALTSRLVRATPKFEALLSGQRKPTSATEALDMASLCSQGSKRLYVAAARFFGDAFLLDPDVADQPAEKHRLYAASCAILAADGKGKDTASLDDAGRSRLRREALVWLRADLELLERRLRGDQAKHAASASSYLRSLQRDVDLTSVRGDAIAKLPGDEQEAWRQFWADVAATLATISLAPMSNSQHK